MDNKFAVITAPQQKSCAFKSLKVCLIIFQVLCFIGSVILIVLGGIAVAMAKEMAKEGEDPQKIRTDAIFVIIAGSVALLISLIGMIGSIKEKFGLTLAFAIIIIVSAVFDFALLKIWNGVFDVIVAFMAFYFAYLIKKEVRGGINVP